MEIFRFGSLPKKNVEIDEEGNVKVTGKLMVNGDFNTSKVKVIYVKKPSLGENGSLFLSFTGDPMDNPVLVSNGFIYTKKQQEDIDKFIELVQATNEEITVKDDTGASVQRTKQKKAEKNAIKCPKCKSINVDFMGNNRKGFSVGKAVAGGVLTGGIGTVAGFAGKKGKNEWHCKNCGSTFQTKK